MLLLDASDSYVCLPFLFLCCGHRGQRSRTSHRCRPAADEAPNVDIGQGLCKPAWPERLSIYTDYFKENNDLILCDCHIIVFIVVLMRVWTHKQQPWRPGSGQQLLATWWVRISLFCGKCNKMCFSFCTHVLIFLSKYLQDSCNGWIFIIMRNWQINFQMCYHIFNPSDIWKLQLHTKVN